MTTRAVHHVIKSMAASNGAGLELRGSLDQSAHAGLDSFPVLDEFSLDDAADHIEIETLLAHVGAGIKATDDR